MVIVRRAVGATGQDKLPRSADWHVCAIAKIDFRVCLTVTISDFPVASGLGLAVHLLCSMEIGNRGVVAANWPYNNLKFGLGNIIRTQAPSPWAVTENEQRVKLAPLLLAAKSIH